LSSYQVLNRAKDFSSLGIPLGILVSPFQPLQQRIAQRTGVQGQGQETCCRIDLLGFQHLLLRLLLDLLWDLLLRLLMRLLEEMVSHHFFERRKMDGENGKLDGVWSLEMDYSRILGCPQFGKMDLCG